VVERNSANKLPAPLRKKRANTQGDVHPNRNACKIMAASDWARQPQPLAPVVASDMSEILRNIGGQSVRVLVDIRRVLSAELSSGTVHGRLILHLLRIFKQYLREMPMSRSRRS